jgi:hypothetical protein
MSASAAFASTVELESLDPSKHVNYTLGMVLGVADFRQEFAYHAGHLRLLAREAVGYGTTTGLAVTLDSGTKGPRIVVSAGTAIMPSGQLVCVKPNQCAYLNEWLTANKTLVDRLAASPLNTVQLELVLCYKECSIDPVAIPGEPCRVESELTAPSRVADSFSLELRELPPQQQEADLLRELVDWLQNVPVGGGGPFTSANAVAEALRHSVHTIDSPLASPPAVHISLGSPLASLNVNPLRWEEAAAAAFRVWVTEIRPMVHTVCPGGCGCCSDSKSSESKDEDDCLLLARIDIPVVPVPGGWQVSDVHPPSKDESRRPLLVSLRVQQEWLQALSPRR